MKTITSATFVLLAIGGINWGLVGLFNYNVVDALVGGTGIDTVVYVLVGLATLWQLYSYPWLASPHAPQEELHSRHA